MTRSFLENPARWVVVTTHVDHRRWPVQLLDDLLEKLQLPS